MSKIELERQILKELKRQNKLLERVEKKLDKLNESKDLDTIGPIHPSPFEPNPKIDDVPPYVINPYDNDDCDPIFDKYVKDLRDYKDNPCKYCSWYIKMKRGDEPYVGDTPCTFCRHSPIKVTCKVTGKK